MKSIYPIDPSLELSISDVLPFNNTKFAWLFRYMNASLRLYHGISRKIDRDDIHTGSIRIPGPSGVSTPALVMKPRAGCRNTTLLVYYHGGGFAVTFAPLHIQLCKQYCRETGCTILLPDYRLMPSHTWPHGFEDSYHCLEWAIREAEQLGIDAHRIIVGGDSAGGALAAGVAQKARDLNISLAGQMLIYPILDSRGTTWSANEYKSTPLWNARINENVWNMYLQSFDRNYPPLYAAPGLSDDLQRLPPAYIETAEFDPLHDEGVNYAKALEQAGVSVELNETRGTFHGFEMASKSPLRAQSIYRRINFLQNLIRHANESASK